MNSKLARAFTGEGARKNGLAFFRSYVWLMILIIILDLASKWAVQGSLAYRESVPIINGWLYVTLTHNTGAAWGVGSGGGIGGRILWIVVSLLLSAALIGYYATQYRRTSTPVKVGLALMIAGALGNTVDRLLYWEGTVGFDGVIDWIDFHTASWSFPTFNLADSALVIGVIVLAAAIVAEFIREAVARSRRTKSRSSAGSTVKKDQGKAEEHPSSEESPKEKEDGHDHQA